MSDQQYDKTTAMSLRPPLNYDLQQCTAVAALSKKLEKKAEVVTIPKPGKDPKFPQNRKPISLLSGLGKIYERILLDRMNKFIFTNDDPR